MEDSNTSRTPGNRKRQPASKADFSDQEVEEYMQMAARMLYDIIKDYLKEHPEKVKPPDEPTDATKSDKSP